MQFLLKFSRLIDATSRQIGRFAIWLILATTLISAGNAIVRKIFSVGSNSLLEIQWYLFAAVFMLASGYALLKNAHVRIDFISSRLSPRTRNWIDVVGIVGVLIPFCVTMVLLAWPYFVQAFHSGEMSQNAGGLIRWPVYAMLPLGFFLLLLQAFSELIKRALFLSGHAPDSLADEDHQSEEKKHFQELEAIAARNLAGDK